MTAVNSSKGFFGTYFKYRLGVMKINFVLCCILNVLGLPLYAAAANKGFGGVDSDFAITARVFSMICIIALPLIAIFNALASFDYYHKKDLTDTIGSLSISHKQRFFADLLAGLVVNAVPIIPCGIISAIIIGGTQVKLVLKEGYGSVGSFHMESLGFFIAAMVLFIVVFTYLFAVLTSVCCGKVFHSVVFAVIAIVTLPLIFGNLARCYGHGILGIDSLEYYLKAVTFFPPAGLFRLLYDAMDAPFSSGAASSAQYVMDSFGVWQVLVYLILAAGLIAGAYCLSKRRLAEHTGSAFAVKPMFWVLNGGITAAATILTIASAYDSFSYGYVFGAAAAGILTCLVTVLLYRQKIKTFLRTLIVGAGAVAVMLLAWLLIDKTGSFGARYLPKNPDKIESITLNGTYTITDKGDIEIITTMLNDELRKGSSHIDGGNWHDGNFYVQAELTNGTRVKRLYGNGTFGKTVFRSLNGYVDYFFDEVEKYQGEQTAYLSYTSLRNLTVFIPDEMVPKLVKTLREEAKEKHDPNAKIVAEIVFPTPENFRFEIEENYTGTIALLTTSNEDPEIDPDLIYLSLEYNIIYGENMDMFSIKIPYKDKDDDRVKELVSLLEDCEDGEFVVGFKVNGFFSSEELGVTEKHKARVVELMGQLAANYIHD